MCSCSSNEDKFKKAYNTKDYEMVKSLVLSDTLTIDFLNRYLEDSYEKQNINIFNLILEKNLQSTNYIYQNANIINDLIRTDNSDFKEIINTNITKIIKSDIKNNNIISNLSNIDIDPSVKDDLLIYSFNHRNLEGFKSLLQYGASPNAKKNKISLITACFTSKEYNFIEELVLYNVDPNVDVISNRRSVKLIAGLIEEKQEKIIYQIFDDLSFNDYVTEDNEIILHLAVKNDLSSQLVEKIISQTDDLSRTDKKGLTPLAISARENNLRLIKLLYENNADLTHTTSIT